VFDQKSLSLKNISKLTNRRKLFVVVCYSTHCPNLGAIGQIPFGLFAVSASSEKIDSRKQA